MNLHIPFCAFFLFFTLLVAAQDCGERRRLITVTGTAEISVAPDQVILSLGVLSRDKDLAMAKSQHDSRVKKLLAETRDAGVEPKNVQTRAANECRLFRGEVPRFLAYEVTQTIEILSKILPSDESLTTKLLQDGVNRINSANLLVAEDRKYKDESRL